MCLCLNWSSVSKAVRNGGKVVKQLIFLVALFFFYLLGLHACINFPKKVNLAFKIWFYIFPEFNYQHKAE